MHNSTGIAADGTSYSKRGWCRLEQLAFILVHGMDHAFLYDSSLEGLSTKPAWVSTAINVFSGNFSRESDKPLLVDIVLGLYGFAILSKEHAEDSPESFGRHG